MADSGPADGQTRAAGLAINSNGLILSAIFDRNKAARKDLRE
jgi:hypothetical protein